MFGIEVGSVVGTVAGIEVGASEGAGATGCCDEGKDAGAQAPSVRAATIKNATTNTFDFLNVFMVFPFWLECLPPYTSRLSLCGIISERLG